MYTSRLQRLATRAARRGFNNWFNTGSRTEFFQQPFRQFQSQANHLFGYVVTPQTALAVAGATTVNTLYEAKQFVDELQSIAESSDSDELKQIKRMIAAADFLSGTIGLPLTPAQFLYKLYEKAAEDAPFDVMNARAASNNKHTVGQILDI